MPEPHIRAMKIIADIFEALILLLILLRIVVANFYTIRDFVSAEIDVNDKSGWQRH